MTASALTQIVWERRLAGSDAARPQDGRLSLQLIDGRMIVLPENLEPAWAPESHHLLNMYQAVSLQPTNLGVSLGSGTSAAESDFTTAALCNFLMQARPTALAEMTDPRTLPPGTPLAKVCERAL